jgi:hypothetical protein
MKMKNVFKCGFNTFIHLTKIGGKEKIREEMDGKVAWFHCLVQGKERSG